MTFSLSLGVIPIVVGPLQVLLAMLPAILVGMGATLVALFKPRTIKLLFKLLWRVKLTVLLVAGVIALLYWGIGEIRSRAGGSSLAAESGEWNMFRGNPARTGSVAGAESPASGGVQWSFSNQSKTFYSSPTLVGNRLYATSADIGALSDKGTIYCLDADTGKVVWETSPPKYRATFSSPSVQGKYLVVGEGLHFTKDARILCLDIEQNGALLWSYRTKSHVESSPAIAGGRIYFGAGTDGYYCFELEPGPDGEPRMVWHLEGSRYPDAETSPVVDGDRVYMGLGIDGHAVVCVEAATGKEIWRVDVGAPVFTPPTIHNGRLYVGMGHGNFILTEEQVIAKAKERLRAEGRDEAEIAKLTADMKTTGAVFCIDLATHEVLWKFETDRTVLNAVVGSDEGLFVASRGGTVYALSHEGKETGRWEAHAPFISSPALTETHLYVVSDGGRLFGLDRRTLKPVWESALGVGPGFVSSPAVGRGHVYVGTPNAGLLCVGVPDSGPETGPLWGGYLGGAGQSGWLDGSSLPDRGTLLWSYPKQETTPSRIAAPVAAVENRIYLPVLEGPGAGLECLEFDPSSREQPVSIWKRDFVGGVLHSPALDAQSVYGVARDGGTDANQGMKLFALDPASGKDQWILPLAGGGGHLALTEAGLLVETDVGQVARIAIGTEKNVGTPVWERDLGSPLSGPPSSKDSILLVATEGPDMLYAMDAVGGALLWSVPLPVKPIGGPIPTESLVYVGTASGVLACRIENGSLAWRADVGRASAAPVLDGERLGITTDSGEVLILSAADGSVQQRFPNATAGISPVLSGDVLLFATNEGWMMQTGQDPVPKKWMATSWLGTLTAPAVVSNSSLIFSTDKRGLIRAGRFR